jgi:hypothetical protein
MRHDPRFRALALFGHRPPERMVRSSLPAAENLRNWRPEQVQQTVLFNQFVGAQQERLRDGQAERLGRFEIDDQLVPGSLLHGQVGWLGTLENFVDVDSGASSQIEVVWRVAHEASRHNIFPGPKDSWQSMLERELGQER